MFALLRLFKNCRTVLTSSLVLTAACFSQAATAAPLIYLSTETPNLITVDPQTQATTLIGSLSYNGTPTKLYDIAFSPSGALYGNGYLNGHYTLFTVDPTSAALSPIGAIAAAGVDVPTNGLVFSDSGVLYASGGYVVSGDPSWIYGGKLVTIDPATGAATIVGEGSFNSAGDLAFVNGSLYVSSVGATASELFTVDPSNAASSRIGGPSATTLRYLYGIATDGQTLYGSTYEGGIATLNTSTGVGTTLFSYPGTISGVSTGGSFGMAIRLQTPPPSSVPAPLPVVGAGMALGLSRKLRRRIRQAKGSQCFAS